MIREPFVLIFITFHCVPKENMTKYSTKPLIPLISFRNSESNMEILFFPWKRSSQLKGSLTVSSSSNQPQQNILLFMSHYQPDSDPPWSTGNENEHKTWRLHILFLVFLQHQQPCQPGGNWTVKQPSKQCHLILQWKQCRKIASHPQWTASLTVPITYECQIKRKWK